MPISVEGRPLGGFAIDYTHWDEMVSFIKNDNTQFAVSCGAVWEGDELVTHNLSAFEHNVRHSADGFLEDSD